MNVGSGVIRNVAGFHTVVFVAKRVQPRQPVVAKKRESKSFKEDTREQFRPGKVVENQAMHKGATSRKRTPYNGHTKQREGNPWPFHVISDAFCDRSIAEV